MKDEITVLINTRNEQSRIGDCIRSALLLSREVIVVDMQSSDRTVEISESLRAKVFQFPFSQYVEPARMYAITQAQTPWVFILDADERVSEELAIEVKEAVNQNKSSFTYFFIPRKNMFSEKIWLRYGGWWPDHQIRLIKKSALHDWPARIHSTPQIEGTSGQLQSPLVHYFHGDVEGMVRKTAIFEDIESTLLYQANRTVRTVTFFRKFLGELVRRLIIQQGFRDGKFGLLESLYQAFSKTITWIYLYEKIYITKPSKNTL